MAACKLTVKQEAYCQGRAKGMTQRQAYKAAYNADQMSDETIDERACVLENKNDKVRTRIVELRAKVERKSAEAAIASAVDVLEELSAIALGTKTFPAIDMFGNPVEAIPSIAQRQKALETLAKYHKLLTDKVEITGAVAAPDLSGVSVDELRELCGLKPAVSGGRGKGKQILTKERASADVGGATREVSNEIQL